MNTTTPFYEDAGARLFHGDCLEVMRAMPDASIHAVVCDPPYGLEFMGKEWDSFKPMGKITQIGVADGTPFRRNAGTPAWGASGNPGCENCGGQKYGNGNRCDCESPRFPNHMAGQMRTFQAWCEEWARECYRILTPGGHLIAFGGSRTWHRLTAGIEDAGFEIRDSIAWLYGSGFPKSLDVSKAIDKQRDDLAAVRVICRWLRSRIDEHATLTVAAIADSFGFSSRMVDHWAARDSDSQPTLPTLEQWDALRDMLGFDGSVDGEVYRLNMRKGEPGEAWADREVVGTVEEWTDRTNYAMTSRDGLRRGDSKNPAAAEWEGWGTALKPAFEPIVVARKPLAGTVAANVLTHGTGALHVRANRVDGGREGAEPITAEGRWPTNVLLDESQAAALDRQTGVLTSGIMRAGAQRAPRDGVIYGRIRGDTTSRDTFGDSGGASRFFPTFRYEAKAPSSERPDVDGSQHPTVKPLDLMRWLVRLVASPGAVILDPFAGSGTTLEACLLEGFEVVGIEKEAEYLPLILQRIRKPLQQSIFDDEVRSSGWSGVS